MSAAAEAVSSGLPSHFFHHAIRRPRRCLRSLFRGFSGRKARNKLLSCLAAGTPVWTGAGPVAVEKVLAGDHVFACDPETGRLALKPVPEDHDPATREVAENRHRQRRAGMHRRSCVLGLRPGWRKARELQTGMHLRTMRGTLEVKKSLPAKPSRPTTSWWPTSTPTSPARRRCSPTTTRSASRPIG